MFAAQDLDKFSHPKLNDHFQIVIKHIILSQGYIGRQWRKPFSIVPLLSLYSFGRKVLYQRQQRLQNNSSDLITCMHIHNKANGYDYGYNKIWCVQNVKD